MRTYGPWPLHRTVNTPVAELYDLAEVFTLINSNSKHAKSLHGAFQPTNN